jgi:O-antigen ligase
VASLLGRWPRYEGLPTLLVYAGLVWSGSRLLGTPGSVGAVRLQTVLALVAVALGGESLAEAWGAHPLGRYDVSRAGSFLGNATDQGLVGVMLALVLLDPAGAGRRWWRWVGVLGAGTAVVLSGSRSADLAAVVGLVVLAALDRRRFARAAALTSVVVAVAVLLVPAARDRLGDSATVHGRRLLWGEAWRMATDHPWGGVGPSRFVDVVGRYHDAAWAREVGAANPPDSPHDVLLQLWLSGGISMLVLGLVLALVLARHAIRACAERRALAAGSTAAVLAWGAALLGNPTSPGPAVLAAVLAGGLLAVSRLSGPEPRWPRLAVGSLAAVLAAALVAASISELVLGRAMRSVAHGTVAAGDREVSRARTLRGGDPDVCMLAAQAFAARAATGDVVAARAARRQAECSLRRTPESLTAGTALAVADLVLGDRAAARRVVARLRVLDPTDPQVRALVSQVGAERLGRNERVLP